MKIPTEQIVDAVTAAGVLPDAPGIVEAVCDVIDRSNWVVVDGRTLAAVLEALQQSCQCSPASRLIGLRHLRGCPMFPFERPDPKANLDAFIDAMARHDELVQAALRRAGA